MKVNEVITEHRMEASKDGTLIISDLFCPLREKEIRAEQLLDNVICCVIKGKGKNWQCPYWRGTIFPMESIYPNDCANGKHNKYTNYLGVWK